MYWRTLRASSLKVGDTATEAWGSGKPIGEFNIVLIDRTSQKGYVLIIASDGRKLRYKSADQLLVQRSSS